MTEYREPLDTIAEAYLTLIEQLHDEAVQKAAAEAAARLAPFRQQYRIPDDVRMDFTMRVGPIPPHLVFAIPDTPQPDLGDKGPATTTPATQ